MARDHRLRFAGADEMRAALHGAVPVGRPPTLVLGNPLPDPVTTPLLVPRRRSRILLWGMAVLVAAVTVIAVIVDAASRPATPAPVGTSTPAPIPTSTLAPISTPTSADVPPPNGQGKGKGHNKPGRHGD
ncbi:hypothetical protein [Mycolicibacterium sp. HS_4_1]